MGKPKCFIIMPISTPSHLIEKYGGDGDHFRHVLECVHVPAVEKAGYEPIAPLAESDDLIHARIIEHLEKDAMVLCDMSTLNPNVFFEWGIRTALNKPVAAIKDELTANPPFDTGIINYKSYDWRLDSWRVASTVEAVASHLPPHDKFPPENSMWKYFGIPQSGVAHSGEATVEDKIDLLMRSVERLARDRSSRSQLTVNLSQLGYDEETIARVESAIAALEGCIAVNLSPNSRQQLWLTWYLRSSLVMQGVVNRAIAARTGKSELDVSRWFAHAKELYPQTTEGL